jgi:microcystin-dependent protein
VSQTTYAGLFNIVGTTYGAPGGGNFNLPDLRGRTISGRDNMGSGAANRLTGTTMTPNGNTLGATGGTQTHVLTTAQLASHTHNVTNAGTGILVNTGGAVWQGGGTGAATTGIVTDSAGSGSAHLNVQPTIIGDVYIKL